jgi:hypothetical protein
LFNVTGYLPPMETIKNKFVVLLKTVLVKW